VTNRWSRSATIYNPSATPAAQRGALTALRDQDSAPIGRSPHSEPRRYYGQVKACIVWDLQTSSVNVHLPKLFVPLSARVSQADPCGADEGQPRECYRQDYCDRWNCLHCYQFRCLLYTDCALLDCLVSQVTPLLTAPPPPDRRCRAAAV
jgi:hypothetical protein